jgi:lactate permease
VHFIALIPFCILFASFVFFRIALVHSAFIALLACVAVAGASVEALQNTLIFLFEIGFIVLGAFFFIEVAEQKGVIQSLADLVKEVSQNRVVQALLVGFPLCLIVEGSSGFGTPLLIIAPILRALGLPILLCALLPLINMIDGIPYGALGTPIRLGFGGISENITTISEMTVRSLYPFFFLTPALSFFLIRRKIKATKTESSPIWILWTLLLSTVYSICTLKVSKQSVEFPVLAGALVTFVIGIFSAHLIEKKKILKIKHRKGLFIYTLLLTTLWLGKQYWMDEKFPGTPIRIFNPGWVFLIFGIAISKSGDLLKPALNRSRRTLAVLFCITFTVQQLKLSGAMKTLLMNLPQSLLDDGIPFLGWLSSAMIGTGTIANLFISPLVIPENHGAVAAATALGVPLAFQSIIGVKSILKDQVSEKEILKYFLPISVTFMTFSMIFRHFTHS